MNNTFPVKPQSRVIRVLIAEDSVLIRTILVHMLGSAADIEVIGQAENGADAVRMATRLAPDVITMDIRMPRMDGLEATRQIMQKSPTPIVVVANSIHDADFNIAFNAIEAGALTVVEKPRGLTTKDYETIQNRLVAAVRMVAGIKVVARWPEAGGFSATPQLHHSLQNRLVQVIAIATSTGGPAALKHIFGQLPADFAFPIVVVQHITPGFAEPMVAWLNDEVKLSVSIAKAGDRVERGKILIAPSEYHLLIGPGGIVQLESGPPIKGQRPSADRLFSSVAKTYSSSAVGIVLTGMGDDGADGIEALGKTGAHIIAQSKETCVVFGMPAEAIERGVVDEILSPDQIAKNLILLHKTSLNFRRPAQGI